MTGHDRHRKSGACRIMQLLVLMLFFGIAANALAQTRAWLDRNSAHLGETVTLNIETDRDGEPDFSVLESDFRIVRRSTNSQVQIINGTTTRSRLWAVALEPLHEGVIGIPPITIGSVQTEPLTLTVQPTPQGSAANGDDVFLEVEAEPRDPYVQQQLTYTVRLFYAVQLLEGSLNEPEGEGLQVRRVGQDANYARDIGGRRYNVVERRYAITPERSGTLQLRGVTFQGRVARTSRFNSMFSQGAVVTVGSDDLALNVRPVPDGAPEPWMPVTALRLQDDAGRLPQQVRVGDALELTLTAEATGLPDDQMPELSLPAIEGAEVYPGQETRQTREVDGRIVGVRSRNFAIVPLRAGSLTLPERRMAWWNVQADQRAHTALPARTIEVLGADGAAASGADDGSGDEVKTSQDSLVSTSSVRLWQSLTAIFALAWLVTLFWLWRVARNGAGPVHSSAPSAHVPRSTTWRTELTQALARGDLPRIRHALLQCDPRARDLSTLAMRLRDPAQREAVLKLERKLYRGDADESVIGHLRAAFARPPELIQSANHEQRHESLPPLYRN